MHPFLTAGTKAEPAVHSPSSCSMCGVPFLSPTACLVLVLAVSERGSFEKVLLNSLMKKENTEVLVKELVAIPVFSPEKSIRTSFAPEKSLSGRVSFTLICCVQKTKRTVVSDLHYFSRYCFIHSCPLVVWTVCFFILWISPFHWSAAIQSVPAVFLESLNKWYLLVV